MRGCFQRGRERHSLSLMIVLLVLWIVDIVWLLFRVLAGFLGLLSFQRGG